MIDLRFPTALQMMLTLAYAEAQGSPLMTSAQLANGLGSTSSLVRKLLVPLGHDGLVRSTLGKTGGVRLAKAASAIHLSEIYSSVTGDKQLLAPRHDIPHRCEVSSKVEAYFGSLAREAEDAVAGVLARRTLADSLVELLAHKAGGRRAGSRSR